jgi:hypothetical protein
MRRPSNAFGNRRRKIERRSIVSMKGSANAERATWPRLNASARKGVCD